LQHFWCEHAGVFDPVLQGLGHQLTQVHLYRGEPVPQPRAFDAWLVMGGPMNVDETHKYAWLQPERELLTQLIAVDAPVMGICLGSQLLARAGGSRVYPKRPKEIGLFNIELTSAAASDPLFKHFENPQEVLQWHGDTFDLPAGAVHLARSPRFEHQAFRLGKRIYALQFHLECTLGMIEEWREAGPEELAELPPEDAFEQYDNRLESALARQNKLAERVIRSWAEMI
jgi:GMP synthase-like glutamine amidotransferase